MTRFVDLDGQPARVVTVDLESREPGGPIVVFESGGGSPLETWDSVFARVAEFAPVVAYDRSGTGESPWDGEPPTPTRVVDKLHRLLAEIGAGPPYLLVGHSWGGALVRYFAGTYPEEVVGILYLDPTDITQSPGDELSVFESIGAGAAERDAFYRLMEESLAAAAPEIRAEAAVLFDLLRSEPDGRGMRPTPDVPASVILAGRPAPLPGGLLPFDTEAFARATLERRAVNLRAWANVERGGEFVVLEGAGHFVHVEEPALVVSAIRELLP
jgi:pimeloyl-ACP methyl ester carboxylesterase